MLQYRAMRRTLLPAGLALSLVLLFAIVLFSVQFSMAPFVRIGMQAVKVLQGQEILFDSEYPPLASSLFYWLQINPLTSFNVGWKALLAVGLLIVTLVALRMERSAWLVPLATLLTIPLLGIEVTLARFDLLVTFLLFVAWLATEHRRDFIAGMSLGLAASLKIVPLFLLPFLWLRSERKMHLLVGAAVGVGLGLLIPALILGTDLTLQNIEYLRSYHGVRGIQLESTWAGLYLLYSAITGQIVTIDNHRRAFEVMGPQWLPLLATILSLAGLAFLFIQGWKRTDHRHLPLGALLWTLLASPILSPQFFVWVIPILLIESYRQIRNGAPRSGWLLLCLTIVTALLTQWIFPILYDQLVHLVLWPILILNLRNLCVLALIIVLLKSPVISHK